eukprot:436667_1
MWFKIKTITLWITLYHSINAENMNGLYNVASGAKQNVPFNTDYSTKNMEYFDVWAPEIATHYGDVFWHDQHDQPLPDHIVKRFAGKVIAITGYEQDQVMVLPPGQPGVNPSQDISVPINWAYNHHYLMWMVGNYSQCNIIQKPGHEKWYNHEYAYESECKDLPSANYRDDPSIPTWQFFSEGNGGESRKSYHGYPSGYAQLVDSPQTWRMRNMQIDTRNRECGASINDINNCTQFIPGPEPKSSRYGRGIPKGTNYSGLLECPCNGNFGGDPLFYGNDTLTKTFVHNYATLQSIQCPSGESVTSANECFDAVENMFGFVPDTKIINQTVSDKSSIPIGCSISNESNIIYAIWNSVLNSEKQCSVYDKMYGNTVSDVGVSVSLELDSNIGNITFVRSPAGYRCLNNMNNPLKSFATTGNSDSDVNNALNECEKYCINNNECNACSIMCWLMNPVQQQCQFNALTSCGKIIKYTYEYGMIIGDVSTKNTGIINITISGPSNVWFGLGFNAQQMADQPYAIIINSTNVWEQQLGVGAGCQQSGDHCAGIILNNSLKLISNTVENNIRIVHIQRLLIGAAPNYYSFEPYEIASINLITAIGESQTFAYHKAHSNTLISLITSKDNTCICDIGANGKLCFKDGTQCRQFIKDCVGESPVPPSGSLITQNNPTCNSTTYSGGMSCCINGQNLLDPDQEIPSELLKYHMKVRFWFQEYIASNSTHNASHINLERIYQQTEANAGEYDIPPAFALPNVPVVGYPNWPLNEPTPGTVCSGNCPNGNDCECIHEIHYKWIENPTKPMRLIYAGGHCHAPMCQSLILYRNDTGEILCSQIPQYGKGNIDKDKYDEAGYILIPPCLWGNDTGLEPSVLLPPGTPLLSKKICKNTHMGHY